MSFPPTMFRLEHLRDIGHPLKHDALAMGPLLGFTAESIYKVQRGLPMYFYSTGKGKRQVSPQIKAESQHEQARSACYVQMRNCLACP